MATSVQVVFDCADPPALAEFWAAALGYQLPPPPPGFDAWESFLTSIGVPESEWGSARPLVDPEGAGPRLYFQRVPEPKTVKNRVHLDLNVSGGHRVPRAEREERMTAEAARLVGLGATQLRWQVSEKFDESCIVMADPEGNEFCVQ
jgi:Glyoxalase-like domain